ncbi:MAG: FAD-dependent oxidoreductase [Dehalococcoidia bacterium]|nr:FAD-dependent oxidoreductase [Dehalococcoidia bacterium]
MTKPALTKLFEPVRIGTMEIRNRIVLPPMGTCYADEDGYVTERMKSYYASRAEGGCGLVILEYTCVDSPEGENLSYTLRIDDDRFIPGLTELAQAIKKHGARAALQLHHVGREGKSQVTRMQPVSASPLRAPGHETPRELSVPEIKRIVTRFADGAERARRAGFDGVEVHSASGYLLNNFLSAASNKRTDEYGGSLENRARILVEILHAIRQKVGNSYPVWCRINGLEWGETDGITIEEAARIAALAERAGADAIHVRDFAAASHMLLTISPPPGNLIPQAAAVKSAVKVPVIASGRIDPELAEKTLREGKADLIAMGRWQIADPEIAGKAAQGRLDEIRPCIACMRCGETVGEFNVPMLCSVNATLSKEWKRKIAPAREKKKVVIVGGGPGGLEAARVAALRGHQVVLYEKGARLGGQLLAASVAPEKHDILPYIKYLEGQMKKLGVTVKLNTEANADLIKRENPDAVVLASGVKPAVPPIPGIDGENVVTAADVLTGKAATGKRVVVLGGGMVGCEAAEVLAGQGKDVTIVEVLDKVGSEIMTLFRRPTLNRLKDRKVAMVTGAKCLEISTDGVRAVTRDGERLIQGESVVLATGARANRDLLQGLSGVTVHLVGDCIQPRKILEAVEDGFVVGNRL